MVPCLWEGISKFYVYIFFDDFYARGLPVKFDGTLFVTRKNSKITLINEITLDKWMLKIQLFLTLRASLAISANRLNNLDRNPEQIRIRWFFVRLAYFQIVKSSSI